MFLRYFDFLFRPFRDARNRYLQVRNIKGNIQVDISRVKGMRQLAKQQAKQAKQMAGKARTFATGEKAAPNVAAGPGSGYPRPSPMATPYGAAPGSPGHPGGAGMTAPPILRTGMLWWKKHLCGQCGQELDRSWDHCPYCSQQAPPPPSAPVAMKTQAIAMDASGQGVGHQMMAWLVPLRGPQRGELFTLAPISSIGTDAGCTVVLIDQYMSGRHAEIKAEGGLWILRDLRSTNGTYVNDKRIDQHELVDSDFVRFGQQMVKFKCL